MISVTKLCRLGILSNSGDIVGYDLSKSVCLQVIRQLMQILSTMSPAEYLSKTRLSYIYPDCIVYMVIRDNKDNLTNNA